MTSPARVVLPAGTFWINGLDASKYGLNTSKALGFRGAGVDKTIIKMGYNTWKTNTQPPANSGTLWRNGYNSATARIQSTLSDLTIQGSFQYMDDGTTAMNTAGVVNAYGTNTVWQNVKMVYASQGSGNNPALGETFAANMFHDNNTVIRFLEVDGRDPNGKRAGAAPFGCNNSTNIVIEDSYFHDNGWSTLTFSITGTPSTASATTGVTTRRVKIAHNANQYLTGGGRMPGINHEHVLGPIRHYNPDIQMDNAQLWDTAHMLFYTTLTDNADIEIYDPVWYEGPPKSNGCFTVQLKGNQVTPPKVFINGVQLSPVISKGQPASVLNVDPATQFVVMT
jgi:hypothetical protein